MFNLFEMEFSLSESKYDLVYTDHNTNNQPVNESRMILRGLVNNTNHLSYSPGPNWVTGFTDAEGSFNIATTEKSNGSLKVTLQYKVTQNRTSLNSLYDLQQYFDAGSVVVDKGNALKYQIQSLDTILNKVLPHFEKFPLNTSKRLDYNDRKSTAHVLGEKGHYSNEGKKLIFDIKSNMNKARPRIDRWDYLNNSKPIIINSEWFTGFIDGEGSFQFSLRERISRNSTYIAANPTLEIAQSVHDVSVLDAFRVHLNSGYIKPKFDINSWQQALKTRPVSRFVTNNEDVVIDLIDKYPLRTSKALDYEDWKTLISMKKEGLHNTHDGFATMQKIKNNMNPRRRF